MSEPEPKPSKAELTSESMLDEVFLYTAHIAAGDGDPRFVQFSPDGSVLLLNRVLQRGADVYVVDGEEPPAIQYESIVTGKYNDLKELYDVVLAENGRNRRLHEVAKGAEGLAQLGLLSSFNSELAETPFVQELDWFIKDGLTEKDVVDAAREAVAHQAISKTDETVLDCASCNGGRADHAPDCGCCNGEGTFAKYPEITIVDPANQGKVTLDLNVAEMLAKGKAPVKRQASSRAYDDGSMKYEEKLYILLSGSIREQLSGLNLDPESTALLADGAIHPVDVLDGDVLDLCVAAGFWRRSGSSALPGSNKVKSLRRSCPIMGSIDFGGVENYTPHELIFAAQHQLSQYLGTVFSKDGFTPAASRQVEVIKLKPVEESFSELRKLAGDKGYSLNFTHFLLNGSECFIFTIQNEKGETVKDVHPQSSFRMAVENAKLEMLSD